MKDLLLFKSKRESLELCLLAIFPLKLTLSKSKRCSKFTARFRKFGSEALQQLKIARDQNEPKSLLENLELRKTTRMPMFYSIRKKRLKRRDWL